MEDELTTEDVADELRGQFRRLGRVAPRRVAEGWLVLVCFGSPWRDVTSLWRASTSRVLLVPTRRQARRAAISDEYPVVMTVD